MSLPAFLEADGYRRVSLKRNAVGHFEAAGTLAGHSVRVLVDTGAASTVVSLSLAQQMGWKLTPLGRNALVAMDLSHVNAALALKGTTPVDVILGVDVFDRQSAVIDYGSSSLFLKEA
jgi:hypothetical protein